MPNVLEHVIDGIEEYDTPLPRWWLYLFYGTIVWAFGYWVVFPSWFGPGMSGWTASAAHASEVAAFAASHPERGGGDIATLIGNPAAIEAGKELFATNCAACHGPEGRGAIGPNLTDATWLYGGTPEDIVTTVGKGTAKGMPQWGPILGPTKVAQTASFVYSLSHPDSR